MRYGITNGARTTLALPLGLADATASVVGALAGALSGRRYNVICNGAEIIGFSGCDTTTWTVLERGVSDTTVTTHVAGEQLVNNLDRDYLEHAAGGGGVGGKLYLAKHYT